MPVPGRDAYPDIYAQSMKKYPDTYGSPIGESIERSFMTQKQLLTNDPQSPVNKTPRYEAIRKDLEILEELSYNTNVRLTLMIEQIAGTQPDNGPNIKQSCDMLSHDHECLYHFISDRISSIRKNLNSINEQLDRL